MNGGTAHNITAKDCYFSIDLRCVGDDRTEDWLEKIQTQIDMIEAEMKAVDPRQFLRFARDARPSCCSRG